MKIEEFIRSKIRPTAEAYRQRLNAFEKFLDGRRITTNIILEWVEDMKKRVSPSTIDAYYSTLKTYLKWGRSTVEVPKLKLDHKQSSREPITEKEVSEISSSLDPDSYWNLLMRLAWETGLRLGDLAMLEWGRVSLLENHIKLCPMKTKRFGKEVIIPISEKTSFILAEKLKSIESRFVIPEAAHLYQYDRHKTLSAQFHRISQRAGVKKSFHCFRHAAVTRMVENGASPAIIASITGHSLKQIMTYVHPSIEAKRKALGI